MGQDLHRAAIVRLLARQGLAQAPHQSPEVLAGDGSDRRFYRIKLAGGDSLIAVAPGSQVKAALAEARSYYLIGSHLQARGVPVPRNLGFDPESGINLVEDLGGTLLHGVVTGCGDLEPVRIYYRKAIELLVGMQQNGARGFKAEFCFDTPRYDARLMREREAGYFERAYCRGLAGLAVDEKRFWKECDRLVDRAASQPAGYLLHRDFQSRNLMVQNGRLRLIDFQGARFGPLQYDLASLLIDPYARLAEGLTGELFDYYLETAGRELVVDTESFRSGYFQLALLRNLQMLGAFAFLWRERAKNFFASYLEPATVRLCRHLAGDQGSEYPYLRSLAEEGLVWVRTNVSVPRGWESLGGQTGSI